MVRNTRNVVLTTEAEKHKSMKLILEFLETNSSGLIAIEMSSNSKNIQVSFELEKDLIAFMLRFSGS